MLAVEIIFLPIVAYLLWRAWRSLQAATRVVEAMPLPPYDIEVEQVWDEIRDRELARG